jgi:hypothetical protein
MSATAKLLNFHTWIETEECCNCGVTFGMPSSLLKTFREDSNKWFYCPNGHRQHFSETESVRLRREIERLKSQVEWQKAARQRFEKEVTAKKGQITKLKNRIAKGVCPCCKRSFSNLARHMADKHPDFSGSE